MSTEDKLHAANRTARIAGALFITATVSSVVGYQVILNPILSAPNYLVNISSNEARLIGGVLVDAINSVAVVAISIVLFPVLKRHSEALALGYVSSRIIESVVLIIGHISLLSLVPISQAYVQAAAPDASHFLSSGALLLAVNDLTYLLGPGVVFAVTALILNYLLYQAELVPRFLSAWGFIGGMLLIAGELFAIFGIIGTTSTAYVLCFLPIALSEMALAVWLIIKGFNPSALISEDLLSQT